MSPGIEYALGAMLFFGIGDLIYKRSASAGVPPHKLLMVQSWVFTPTVALYGLLTGSLTFVAATLWGCLVGLFVLIGFYNFAHSLKSGSISVNAPVFRLSFIITAMLAVILLGESLTSHKIAGMALAPGAVWLLLNEPAPGDPVGRRESLSSLARVLVATAAIGVGNVIYKFGLRAGATPASLIVAQGAVVVVLSSMLAGAMDRRIRPSGAALRYAPLAAIVLATAFIFMTEGLARGDASVVVPVAQMGFCVTALYGVVLLGERFTRRKAAGLVAALSALACLALG